MTNCQNRILSSHFRFSSTCSNSVWAPLVMRFLRIKWLHLLKLINFILNSCVKFVRQMATASVDANLRDFKNILHNCAYRFWSHVFSFNSNVLQVLEGTRLIHVFQITSEQKIKSGDFAVQIKSPNLCG